MLLGKMAAYLCIHESTSKNFRKYKQYKQYKRIYEASAKFNNIKCSFIPLSVLLRATSVK